MYYFFACAMLLLAIVSTERVSTQLLYLLFAGVFVIITEIYDIKKISEDKKDDDKDS